MVTLQTWVVDEYVARVYPQKIRENLYVLRIVSLAENLGNFRNVPGSAP